MFKMHMHVNEDAIRCLAYNVSYLRKELNISKNKMAEILGIGVKTLTKIEQGILPPRLSVKVLFKIQQCFGIPVSVLVGRKINV